ncbi:MAG: hypothetical protein CMH83_03130 [Nocardioides sp.]|nr:hypothetical protein [Nocardioides sp.]
MADSGETVTHIEPSAFVTYLEKTRWFGGKGRPFEVTDVRRLGRLGDGAPRVDVLLVQLTYGDVAPGAPDAVELYQVPLACYTEAEHRLDHAFIGWWEDPEEGWLHAYDALHDKEAMALWLAAFVSAEVPTDGADAAEEGAFDEGGIDFRRLPGHELEPDATASLFSGEQSNSSVRFGEDSVLKVFRKITPGANPDITTHAALTRAGSEDVAHLYGWVQAEAPDGLVGPSPDGTDVLHLGMLQKFLRTATDGWELALSSVRTLYAEEGVDAEVSGGDFEGEAARLGLTLRAVHDLLVEHFGTGTTDASAVADQMTTRLDAAVAAAPALGEHRTALTSVLDRLRGLGELPVQRVHGDLHLGQTLRTSLGWKIVDFEGEPAKPLAERLLPDSPWRDVAGMLRSFDYAPHVVARQADDLGDEENDADRRVRGAAWAARNQLAFLAAYAGGELSDTEKTLVDAYLADKAVYETVYETRNRPAWVEIPLSAVARIGVA